MKKTLLVAVVSFFSFMISISINAQTVCAGLQADIDRIQEQVEQLDKKKFFLEEFFSLVDVSKPDMNSLREELSITEEHIKKLQMKITSGDKSDETAADLRSLRARTELINLRLSKNFNETTFFKHPKYLELLEAFNQVKKAELEFKTKIAVLGFEMSENKCPRNDKKPKEDDEITTDLDDTPDINVKNKESDDVSGFDYSKVSGNYGSEWGPVQLNVSKSSVSGSWKQGSETGKITGGSFDAKTKILTFTYSQSWNNKTGKVKLVFSETPTEYKLSGTWGHNDNSGSGNWGLKRPK